LLVAIAREITKGYDFEKILKKICATDRLRIYLQSNGFRFMRNLPLLLLALFAIAERRPVKVVAEEPAPADAFAVVRTQSGGVSGTVSGGGGSAEGGGVGGSAGHGGGGGGGGGGVGVVHIFKGIPYAAPPVGELRWKAPRPVIPWTGVRKCESFGPSPMQAKPAINCAYTTEFLIPEKPISEDCLYLNVWTGAKKPGDKLPVLVYIYGGGFISGGSAIPIYDGEAMARKGVVFVSINYRVGIFGFLCHPWLGAESGNGVSGNYGLLDQIAALRWVKENIAAFGGDAANVTIAGESAGAISVSCLVASPLAKGLFRRAIAESGAAVSRGFTSPALLKEAEQTGQAITTQFKVADLTSLRAISAEKLQAAGFFRGPVIDGHVLPYPIDEIYRKHENNPCDLLTGWNEDDYFLYGAPQTAVQFRQQVQQQYGAFHGGEIVYAYNNLAILHRPWEAVDHQLAETMSGYWVNFARTGDPNGGSEAKGTGTNGASAKGTGANSRDIRRTDASLPRWPVYNVTNVSTMILDEHPHVGQLPDKDALDFLLRIPDR
jgi:carboxylesterase type B